MSVSRCVLAVLVTFYSFFSLYPVPYSAAGCTPYAASLIADYFDPVSSLCLWSEFVFSNVDTPHVNAVGL